MSISGALSNALSGLNASARAAGVASTNLANVLTPGYGPRALELTSQRGGSQGGVSVVGITRHVDLGVVGDRRLADAQLGNAQTRAGFIEQIERAVGIPGETGSLSARIAAFDAALVSAGNQPETSAWLQAAVVQAGDLAQTLNHISQEIQSGRTEADHQIAQAVEVINTTLERVQTLNSRIIATAKGGNTSAALEDQRQMAIDQLAEFIPIRQVPRDGGAIALFTPGGATLLDGIAARFEFTQSNIIAPHMTPASGLLPGLQVNGVAIATDRETGPIAGGRLAALFEVRDQMGVDANTQIDALARDLIDRFQAASVDPTRPPGAAGLFTDAGAPFSAPDEPGIAGRIALNAAVDPQQGGAIWRLRDGLGAATPGPAGNGTLLQQLQQALSQSGTMSSGDLGATSRSHSGHAAGFVSRIGQSRLTQDQEISFAAALQSELTELEMQGGVDSDEEMQRLLLIEQSYAANARMIQTLDEMMQALLRI